MKNHELPWSDSSWKLLFCKFSHPFSFINNLTWITSDSTLFLYLASPRSFLLPSELPPRTIWWIYFQVEFSLRLQIMSKRVWKGKKKIHFPFPSCCISFYDRVIKILEEHKNSRDCRSGVRRSNKDDYKINFSYDNLVRKN